MRAKKFIAVALTVITMLSTLVMNVSAAGSTSDEGINNFVKRMYSVCLDRQPDDSGLKYWNDLLVNKKATGCSVACGFVFSQEFTGKNYSDKDYVRYMYAAFFGREPDTEGSNYWISQLTSGTSREMVFAGFTNSKEFADLCEECGIVRGYYLPGFEPQKTAQVSLFVERLYNVILDRNCDTAGMEHWTTQLCTLAESGSQVAFGFVFSDEFKAKHLCNSHYVEVLYEAFMGRSSDEGGKSHWLNQLSSGVSREDVFNGFACSQEFNGICSSYGINAGSVSVAGVTFGGGSCAMCNGTSTTNPTKPGASVTPTQKVVKPGTAIATATPIGWVKPTATPTPTRIPGATATPTPTPYPDSGWKQVSQFLFYIDPLTGEFAIGWKEIEGDTFYFDEYGAMEISWQTIDGKKYYFGNDGVMRKGWAEVYTGSWYYFGDDGVMCTGFLKKDGKLYYLTDSGSRYENRLKEIEGNTYFFDEEGKAVSGWKEDSYGAWYYFDSTTFRAVSGWQTIKNKDGKDIKYYFDPTYHTMYTGEKEIKTFDSKGKLISTDYYRFKDSGALITGWYKDDNEKWHYYEPADGKAGSIGWHKYIDSKNVTHWFYIKDMFGTVAQKEIVTTDKGSSYIDSNCYCVYGWYETFYSDGKTHKDWYYADKSGYLLTGWQTIGGKEYYFYADFSMAHNTYVTKDGKSVYVDSNGQIK